MPLSDFEKLLWDMREKRPSPAHEPGVDVNSPEYKDKRAEAAKQYEEACQKAQAHISDEIAAKGYEHPEVADKRRLLTLALR